MNTTVRRLIVLLLLIFAAPLFAASTTPILRGLLQTDLNGNRFGVTNLDTLIVESSLAKLTNTDFSRSTNTIIDGAKITTTGGTQAASSTNINNALNGGMLIGVSSVAGGVNRITGSGASFLLGVTSLNAGTNEITTSSGFSFLAGSSRQGLNKVSGGNGFLVANSFSGTNEVTAGPSIIAADAAVSSYNLSGASGMVGGMSATTGGSNFLASPGTVASAWANAGTNVSMTGRGGIFAGYATDTNSVLAGTASIAGPYFTMGFANLVFGSLANLSPFSFVFGSGYTNSTSGSNTFSVGFGSQLFNVRSNGVGIGTNAPQYALDVNGAAVSHFAFLSLTTSQLLALDTGVYGQITNYQYAVGNGFNVSPAGGNQGSVTNTAAGWYKVAWQISCTGGNGDALEATVFTNLVECPLVEGERTLGAAAAIGSFSGLGTLYLPAGTRVDLRIQNTGDADDVTLERAQLNVGHP